MWCAGFSEGKKEKFFPQTKQSFSLSPCFVINFLANNAFIINKLD